MKKIICIVIAVFLSTVLNACSKKETPVQETVQKTVLDLKQIAEEENVSVQPTPNGAAGIYKKAGITYLIIEGYEMILVNKQFHLPSDCGDGTPQEAQNAYDSMVNAAYAAGCPIWLVSGFRSYETQESIFNKNAAKDGEEQANAYSARPGQSEHQTGLAFDIGGADSEHILEQSFAGTKEFRWLMENAADYGFILRFLEGKEFATGYMYEPWHFRYVGVELAHLLADCGLSVEEYAGLL